MPEILNNNLSDTEIKIECGNMFSFPTHTHSHYEMTVYRPFDGGITVNGEFFEVNVPSAFLISPSDFHRISVQNEQNTSRFIKIGFIEKAVSGFFNQFPKQPIILKNLEKHPLLSELFDEILEHSEEKGYVTVLIASAMLYIIKHGTAIQPAVNGKKHTLVMDVLRYINGKFAQDVTLYNTAEHYLVSPQYLSSAFADEVGIGFSAYITELRLKKAAELLISSKLNITEICFECGYRNLSHFLRSFKEKYGITPKAYRKLYEPKNIT